MKLTEHQLAVKRKYREANRDFVRKSERERQAVKRRNEPEKYILANCKARAKREDLPFDLTLGDLVIPEVCPVYGIPIQHNFGGKTPSNNSPSLDKVIPALGYVKGNVRIISHQANRDKSNLSQEQLELLLAYVKGDI